MRAGFVFAATSVAALAIAACYTPVTVQGNGDGGTSSSGSGTGSGDDSNGTGTGTGTGTGGDDDDGGSMSSSSDGGSSGGGGGTADFDGGPVVSGEVTYYGSNSSGNCSFGDVPNLDFAAMSLSTDYAGSAACGECIHIKGPKGEVTVLAVDSCPGCDHGHIDLSDHAFAQLDDKSAGVAKVTWQVVPCDVMGPISYAFTSGISVYYFSVQIRNSRYPITKLELMVNGSFMDIERKTYNEFVLDSKTALPWTLRVTASTGETLTDTFSATNAGMVVAGHAQF